MTKTELKILEDLEKSENIEITFFRGCRQSKSVSGKRRYEACKSLISQGLVNLIDVGQGVAATTLLVTKAK